jgi:hypothetical protein
VSDAIGWYLTQDEKRDWTEDFADEETGEVVPVERSEIVCKKGVQINEITASLLRENGISTVNVSSIPILGNQQKIENIWETILKVKSKNGVRKKTYIVTAECPAAAEKFISEWIEINNEVTFEIVKINKLEYSKVIKIYDTQREEFETDGKHWIKWYKCQIFAMIDDNTEDGSAGAKTILVQATDFENAIEAVKSVMNRDEFDSVYTTFKTLQELNIVEVFIPDEDVSYYSRLEL